PGAAPLPTPGALRQRLRLGIRRERAGSMASRHPEERIGGQACASDVVGTLGKLLARALRSLGDAGEREKACEFAAEAWAALRREHPKEAERMNGVLHY